MISLEEAQEVFGETWTVLTVLPPSWQLVLPEEDVDKDKVFEKLETIWNICEGYVELKSCPEVDGVWHAAETLLGPKKLKALQEMFADNYDSLSAELVAHAILGGVEETADGLRFEIGPALQERVDNYVERELKPLGDSPSPWVVANTIGWLEFLPTEFDIRRLDEETDSMLLERCCHTLAQVACLFPNNQVPK